MQSQPTKAKRRTKTKAPGVYRSVSGSYEIAYCDSDGRRIFKTVGSSFEDAKATRAEVVSKLGKGEQVRVTKQRFETFAESVVAGLSARPRTIEKHRYHLTKNVNPTFGTKRLGEITTGDVARLVAKLESAGLGGWTILGALSSLSLVMRKAKRQGLIPANPVADLERDERPKLDQKEKRVLDQAEITTLLAKSGDTFRPLIATMIFTGTRLGEAIGLTWGDVDFEDEQVHVRFQLDRDHTRAPLKTSAGRRDVVLIPQLATVLKKLKEQSFARGRAKASDLVFTNPDGTSRAHRSTSRGVERAIERAGLGDGLSSHSFRHTFASLLIVGLNLDPVRVAKQLGHTNPSFTQDTYAHLFEQARHATELRDKLAGGFGHLLDVTDLSLASDSGELRGQTTTIRKPHVAVG